MQYNPPFNRVTEMDPAVKAELASYWKYVKIAVVEDSQLPYRVVRKRNESIDGQFATEAEAVEFVRSMNLEALAQKPSRGRYVR